VEANDDFVILSWKAREPKIGKVKETVQRSSEPYGDIKEAIVTVTF
jgi:ribosome maturation factor RimP